MSQFRMAKEHLEALDPEYLAGASEEELEKHVFNFLYLGKIYTDKRIQQKVKKKYENNRIKHSTNKQLDDNDE